MQGSSLQTFTPVPDPKETSSILQTGIVYHAQQGTWVETEPMEINWRLGLSLQAQEIFSMYCSSQDMCAQPLDSIVLDAAKHRRVRYTTVLLSHGTKQEVPFHGEGIVVMPIATIMPTTTTTPQFADWSFDRDFINSD
ncbi:unnamed protein product [Sphagnum jensenii]